MTEQRTGDDVSQLRSMLRQSDKLIAELRAELAGLSADNVPEALWATTQRQLADCVALNGDIAQALAERTAA